GNDLGQELIAGFGMEKHEIFVNRSFSGKSEFSEHFPGVHTAPYWPQEPDNIRIRAIIDRSSIELFVDNGRVVMTELFFPEKDFDQVKLYSKNGSVLLKKGTIHGLKNTW
ncbi:MAG: GH32 C-terminal domain-containing protein, partial [Bacteroidales bacterium]|nr:GH32 C-terminal domain-containing protein [Bacteroidales bacterium]